MTHSVNQPHNDRLRAALDRRPVFPVARGELWLGTGLFDQVGYEDTLDNHVRLAASLGQDLVCLPVTDGRTVKPALGYRYFSISDLKTAAVSSDLPAAAIVDGPFQELVNQTGLMSVLTGWAMHRQDIISAYESQSEKVLSLIRRCLDRGVQALVITDDMAADRGLLISPPDIDRLCTPFYTRAVADIHAAGVTVFLHSCGRITRLLPLAASWGIDGLAAIQLEINDPGDLRGTPSRGPVIMAGIDAQMLEPAPCETQVSRFKKTLSLLAGTGGFILCSSCGLYKKTFLERIKLIYQTADQVTQNPGDHFI